MALSRVVWQVKSMQMFRKNVKRASQGDRLGICVTAFDAKDMERGLASAIGTVPTVHAAIVLVKKIRYYKMPIKSGTKWPVTVGHYTVFAAHACTI